MREHALSSHREHFPTRWYVWSVKTAEAENNSSSSTGRKARCLFLAFERCGQNRRAVVIGRRILRKPVAAAVAKDENDGFVDVRFPRQKIALPNLILTMESSARMRVTVWADRESEPSA